VLTILSGQKEDDAGTGYSHSLKSLHEGYLAEFEKSCEWAIEVEGGDPKMFFAQCEVRQSEILHSISAEAS